GQDMAAEIDGAAAGDGADGFVGGIEGEGAAGVDVDCGGVAKRVGGAELQGAGVDCGAPGVGVAAGEGEGAGALFEEIAGAGNDAGIGAGAGLVEDQLGAVGDVALQRGGIALQSAGGDGGAA